MKVNVHESFVNLLHPIDGEKLKKVKVNVHESFDNWLHPIDGEKLKKWKWMCMKVLIIDYIQ